MHTGFFASQLLDHFSGHRASQPMSLSFRSCSGRSVPCVPPIAEAQALFTLSFPATHYGETVVVIFINKDVSKLTLFPVL